MFDTNKILCGVDIVVDNYGYGLYEEKNNSRGNTPSVFLIFFFFLILALAVALTLRGPC